MRDEAEVRAMMAETKAALDRGETQPPKVAWWWEPRRADEMTPEYLGRVLAEVDAGLAEHARLGHFDDFHAPAEVADGLELVHLVAELRRIAGREPQAGLLHERCAAVENAVRRGEFDATRAESDRWAASKDGQDAFAELARSAAASKTGRNDPCPCGSGLKYKRCCGA